jgi:(1->4)-alpha-D-glucan 1-alpha-D-glucosylmutase
MPRDITSTYRLQLTREFPISAARTLVPYFHRLGISHLYLSPILAARAGSTHGYDVIDHSRLNPELGSDEELRALAKDLHARAMGIVLDIVPNHMSASADNPYWDDVLRRGAASRHAGWFDVDWDAPHAGRKVVLPLLGDELDRVIERGELTLHIRDNDTRVAYFDKTFPLDPATLPKELQLARLDPAARPAADAWAAGAEGRKRLRALLDAQHYRLRCWGTAHGEINYRRFFDINELVALQMESDEIFDATHALILGWVKDGIVDGLRVDHIDGMRLPLWYLAKLRGAVDAVRHPDAPERFPIVVEKILSENEALPHEWPVDGTTGYDFMNDAEELLLDSGGFKSIEANYRGLRHNPSLDFEAVARDGKRQALNGALLPDLRRIARAAHAWRKHVSVDAFAAAIVELIVHLDVYRTYVDEPGVVREADRRVLIAALRLARQQEGADDVALSILSEAFLAPPAPADTLRRELVTRLQQTSGPATAKGVEDTALYAYLPVASRNEVGGKPDRTLSDAAARAHARNAERQRDWPQTLLATNTHDTKRSADLRARLDALTGVPDEWARYVARWRRLNKPRKRVVHGRPAPETNAEYLYYQTLVGLWPAPRRERRVDDLPSREWLTRARERSVAYMLKAAREAKTRTSWAESDAQYETALDAFVLETLEPGDDAPFLGDVARLIALVAENGFRLALARITMHLTAPGIPDLYQGDELWNFTLVDPDNRRAIDFDRRRQLLEHDERFDALLRDAFSGVVALTDDRVKLALTARLLRFRREHALLMRDGDYVPLQTRADVFAFSRTTRGEAIITVARTGAALSRTNMEPAPGNVIVCDELAGQWQSVLTGRFVELVRNAHGTSVPVDSLIATDQPCELLFRPTS